MEPKRVKEMDFERAIGDADVSLFDQIETQTTNGDRESLLSCQAAVRSAREDYIYLEIGSYLGGTIVPHLLDPKCSRIISIDKRPEVQPDERGVAYRYNNNSTARMLDNLGRVDETAVEKVQAIDGDASEIDDSELRSVADLCFIDGEHTDGAVYSDFLFCLWALKEDGLLVFHDAPIVYKGLSKCVDHLEREGIQHRSFALPNTVFVVEIGGFRASNDQNVKERLMRGAESYLYSLEANDYYRQFANKGIFRLYRRMVTRWKGLNRFD